MSPDTPNGDADNHVAQVMSARGYGKTPKSVLLTFRKSNSLRKGKDPILSNQSYLDF